ncbi:zinc finger, CCHC-type containing protein [Tanacetum coccineum]
MAVVAMSVVYALPTPIPKDSGDDPTVEQVRKRNKWDNDDYKEELTLVELGSHLRIEESLRVQDSDKPKGNNVVGPRLNIVNNIGKSAFMSTFKLNDSITWLNIGNDNITSAFMSTSKLNDLILWHARLGHVHFKRMQDMSKDGLILAFDMDTEKCKTCMLNKITKKPFQNVKHETEVLELIHSDLCDLHATPSLGNKKYFVTFIDDASRAVVRLHDSKLKTLGKRGMECIFVGYVEHSNAFRFYVIEPNDSVSINSIIESNDVIFDENKFSSVPKLSLRIPNGTEDIGGSVVPEEVTEKVVQQPESELRKTKRNRNPNEFRPEFQLYLIEGTRDEVSYQHSNCFNIEDDSKTFDEANEVQDVAFWKEAINDEIDSIMGNNTWVLADLPPGCKPLGCKWIFKRKLKVDGNIEKIQGKYHKTADCYGINSQSDYSSDGCEDNFLEW